MKFKVRVVDNSNMKSVVADHYTVENGNLSFFLKRDTYPLATFSEGVWLYVERVEPKEVK